MTPAPVADDVSFAGRQGETLKVGGLIKSGHTEVWVIRHRFCIGTPRERGRLILS